MYSYDSVGKCIQPSGLVLLYLIGNPAMYFLIAVSHYEVIIGYLRVDNVRANVTVPTVTHVCVPH